MGSAVRRRCPRGPAPPPEGHMPQPANARKGGSVGTPACGLVLRGLVGAIGWSSASPWYAGDAAAAGCFMHPFLFNKLSPPRGCWAVRVFRIRS